MGTEEKKYGQMSMLPSMVLAVCCASAYTDCQTLSLSLSFTASWDLTVSTIAVAPRTSCYDYNSDFF